MPVYRSHRQKQHEWISRTQKTKYVREIRHKGNGSVYDRLLIASNKETWVRFNAFSVYSVTTGNSNA
jgi:hypothetical protein